MCCCQRQVPTPFVNWSAVTDSPLSWSLCAAYLDAPDLGYTVFAPTNAAFQKTFNSLNTNLTDILYMGHLDALIQYHFLLQPYTVRPVQCSPLRVHAVRGTHPEEMRGDGQPAGFILTALSLKETCLALLCFFGNALEHLQAWAA